MATAVKPREVNITSASSSHLLEQRVNALKSELEQTQSMQDIALQLIHAKEEIESYKKHYSVSMEIRRCLTKELET